MSKQNNLTDLLYSISSAIRTRKEYPSSRLINPQDFEDEILTIPSGISINTNFHAVYEMPQEPVEDDVYLIFDIAGEIPSELPDVSGIDRLNLVSLFDYRLGNIYGDDSVNVFSWYVGKENYHNIPIKTLPLGGVTVDFGISKLVSVVNINEEQKKCRVAIHANNRWVICNYVEVPRWGTIDTTSINSYLSGIMTLVDDITTSLGSTDDVKISQELLDCVDTFVLNDYLSGITYPISFDLITSLGATDTVEQVNVDHNN